jgi:hypothetical protein
MQPSESLADANVVQTFHDGRKLLRDGSVVRDVPANAVLVSKEITSGRVAARTLERMHRTLGDLPDIPQRMNPAAAVIFYHAVGLNDADIATALGATEAQIKTIRESEVYQSLFKLFDVANFEEAKRNARHIIAKASDKAASTVVDAMDSDDALIRLSASKEVLRMSDVSLENKSDTKLTGLHIRITRKQDESDDIHVELNNG